MDAKTTSSSTSDQSIQLELDRHILANLRSSLGIFAVAGIILFAINWPQNASLHSYLWLGSLLVAILALWLWHIQSTDQSALCVTSLLVCAVFWGIAGPVFINPNQLETAAMITAVVVIFTATWPLLPLQTPFYRQLFLLCVYVPLSIGLTRNYAGLSPGFPLLITGIFVALNLAYNAYRRTFINNLIANELVTHQLQQTINTSKKITSLIEQTPLGFIEWNQNREIVGWNPAATAIFGFSKTQALGRTTDFLFEDKKTFLMEQAEHDLFLFGKDFSGTAENITSDGTPIICEWNETPLFDDDMNVIGAASFVEDVTDRVRMQTRIKQQAYFDPPDWPAQSPPLDGRAKPGHQPGSAH
jgi:PAS domain S-box-containing protein